ncbi:F-box only protein 43-like [Acropora muricata]|uniref:F-box only protein 43-like n=1 Tax=Acropora muricata TaxID=159855 RepID=UPI0034E4EC19
MEEAKRDEKKKGNAYDVPSCFLSPESPGDHKFGRSTPIFDASSASCFLTPPSSSEKVVNSRTRLDTLQDLTKLNFELDDGDRESPKQKSSQSTPLQPEYGIIQRRCEEIRLDIISELLAYNCTSICENICSYLKPQDLLRFGCVSRRWRRFVKNCHLGERYREYIKQCEAGKENRGTPHFQKSTSFEDTRFPLAGINFNIPQRQGQDQHSKVSETSTTQIYSSHTITPQIKNKLRPCPKCMSPSNISNSQNGHCQCQNQKCGLSFCPACLRDTQQHALLGECNGLSTALEKRLAPHKSGKDIVGSKKTKDRLKRL